MAMSPAAGTGAPAIALTRRRSLAGPGDPARNKNIITCLSSYPHVPSADAAGRASGTPIAVQPPPHRLRPAEAGATFRHRTKGLRGSRPREWRTGLLDPGVAGVPGPGDRQALLPGHGSLLTVTT
jgi:hypothetical protein